MYIKTSRCYLLFFSILITSGTTSNVFSATNNNHRTPPRAEKSNEKFDFSPQGVTEFPDHANEIDIKKKNQSKERLSSIKRRLAPLFSGNLEKSVAGETDSSLSLIEEQSTQKNELILNLAKHILENEVGKKLSAKPTTIAQFIDTIFNVIIVLKDKGFNSRAIGTTLNEVAEKFADLDYFSVDRFNGTLNEEEQKAENKRLMNNWQKWYTYKILAYFYKNESISKADADIIAANLRSDNIDIYEFSEDPAKRLIYSLGKPFCEDKYNFVQSICAELTRKIRGFDTFINGENESDAR